jgi:hypothetical protein
VSAAAFAPPVRRLEPAAVASSAASLPSAMMTSSDG